MSNELVEKVARGVRHARLERKSAGWGFVCADEPLTADELADAQAALAAIQQDTVAGEVGWQPIETAPKDGTPVLVRLLDNIYPTLHPEREDLKRWNGLRAVMRNRGDVSDWCFAAPVGQGGFPDEWMAGWMPLPEPPSAAISQEPSHE